MLLGSLSNHKENEQFLTTITAAITLPTTSQFKGLAREGVISSTTIKLLLKAVANRAARP